VTSNYTIIKNNWFEVNQNLFFRSSANLALFSYFKKINNINQARFLNLKYLHFGVRHVKTAVPIPNVMVVLTKKIKRIYVQVKTQEKFCSRTYIKKIYRLFGKIVLG